MDTLKRKPARKALGRGLSALISTPPVIVDHAAAVAAAFKAGTSAAIDISETAAVESEAVEGVTFLPVEALCSNPRQPRQDFAETELAELAASITAHGVLQPILVRPAADGHARYEIVAGERRWRAAKRALLGQVPVIIKEIDDRASLELALVENIQRDDLNPIEEAQAYQRLIDEYSLTQQEVAERVGKDRATVANALRLLRLPEEVIQFLKVEKLSIGHAKVILTVKEPGVQRSLARRVVEEGLSVRKLEEIVSRVVVLNTARREPPAGTAERQCFPDVTDRLRKALGTKVVIKHQRTGSGKIEISYFSEEELDRLVELLSGEDLA